jgi:hypothetical protein
MRFGIGCLLVIMPALAQIDSAALRAKYGPPLNREIFRVRPGLDLVVDYGANRQVCSIEMPALPVQEKQQLLDEVAPESTWGKELRRMAGMLGLAWMSWIEYEHVTIVDTQSSKTVRFKVEGCS